MYDVKGEGWGSHYDVKDINVDLFCTSSYQEMAT
jgi:hypothetical protein